MEQGTGVEPAWLAWEARVIPIYEPCVRFSAPHNARTVLIIADLFLFCNQKIVDGPLDT